MAARWVARHWLEHASTTHAIRVTYSLASGHGAVHSDVLAQRARGPAKRPVVPIAPCARFLRQRKFAAGAGLQARRPAPKPQACDARKLATEMMNRRSRLTASLFQGGLVGMGFPVEWQLPNSIARKTQGSQPTAHWVIGCQPSGTGATPSPLPTFSAPGRARCHTGPCRLAHWPAPSRPSCPSPGRPGLRPTSVKVHHAIP